MSSKAPFKVLLVCLGNICRSPTAEVIFKHLSDEHKLNIIVDSAGTSNYHPGKAPDLRSQKHAMKRGYDLSALRARQVIANDFVEFDLILAMDHENLTNLKQLFESVKVSFNGHNQKFAEIAMMSEHDPHYLKKDVPDPYYGGDEGFEAVLNQCESSAQAWIDFLKQQQPERVY